MRLHANQLTHHLQRSPLAKLYLVSGDVPLFIQETCDLLRKTAIAQGYSDRQLLSALNQLYDNTHHLSLFSAKQLFELRLTSIKSLNPLESYANQLPEDVVVIIVIPKLDTATQSTRWFKAVDKNGVIIQVWPIETAQMSSWITQRLKQAGLQTGSDGIKLFTDNYEGNLLGALQAIEKLSLLFTRSLPTPHDALLTITAQDIADIIFDGAQFTLFQWADAVLQKKPQLAIRILRTLREAGTEPLLILWALLRKIRQLPLQNPQRNQQLQQAVKIDRILKGIEPGNAWDLLEKAGLHYEKYA
ncbi:MAG: DNA polymerase III subunit delta [Gammaproteobacteria bacterium]